MQSVGHLTRSQSGNILSFLLPLFHEGQLSVTGESMCTKYLLVNRLGGLSLPRKSVVRLTDRPDMTLMFTADVKQQCNNLYTSIRTVDEIACYTGYSTLFISQTYADVYFTTCNFSNFFRKILKLYCAICKYVCKPIIWRLNQNVNLTWLVFRLKVMKHVKSHLYLSKEL